MATIRVTPSDDPLVTVAPNIQVPAMAVARVADPNSAFDVELTIEASPMVGDELGTVQCRSVTINSKSVPLTSELLRQVPVATYVRAAMSEMHSTTSGSRDYLFADDIRNLADKGPIPETLERVAYVYRLAAVSGEKPVTMVQKTFDVAPGTASRWVALARERGHLGPTRRGKAGG